MKGHNFHHKVLIGAALKPQSVISSSNSGVAAGETIKEPWNYGNQLSFILMGGTFAASADGSCKIQGQKRSDDSWVTLKEKDGATDLQFTVTLLDNGGGLDGDSAGKVALGTIPMSKLDAVTYKAIRIYFVETGGGAMLVAAPYIISELLSEPSGTVDDLFSKVFDLTGT